MIDRALKVAASAVSPAHSEPALPRADSPVL